MGKRNLGLLKEESERGRKVHSAECILVWKHQIPNTCLRRSGSRLREAGASAGAGRSRRQAKFQINSDHTNSKQNLSGHLKLDIGVYLGFACLPCTMLGSGPAGRQGICDFGRYGLCRFKKARGDRENWT